MRKLFAFVAVSVDGRHEGPDGELDWHHAPTAADSGFPVASGFPDLADEASDEVDTLMFGRVTYELMAAAWTTPALQAAEPRVARRMNALPKVVVSRTLVEVGWEGARLLSGNVAEGISALKRRPGKAIGILGSATLTSSLLDMGLLDEVRVLVNPVILGGGRSLGEALDGRVPLTLSAATTFPSGNVLLRYRPE